MNEMHVFLLLINLFKLLISAGFISKYCDRTVRSRPAGVDICVNHLHLLDQNRTPEFCEFNIEKQFHFINTIQKKNHVNSCASKFLLVYGMSKKLMFIIWKGYFIHKKITNVICFWCKMTHYLQYETLMETLFCSTIVADSTVQNLLFVI